MASQVIEAVFYKTPEGRTFSRYSSYIPADAVRVVSGWTLLHPDGTTGLGRPPFATREDAQEWADLHPNFPGMTQG